VIPRYACSLHVRAALGSFGVDEADHRELLDVYEALARSPGRPSTEQVVDESGRTNQVTYTAGLRVVYWADHAVNEVRLMDVRRY
jgi:hypothetical protein